MYEYGNLPHKLSKEESIPVALEIIEIAKDKAYQRTGMNPEFRIQNGKLFPWMKVERYYIRTLDRLIESEGFIDHTTNIAYLYETEEEAREESELAKEEYMRDWDIEGNEYDPDDFEIEIVEV